MIDKVTAETPESEDDVIDPGVKVGDHVLYWPAMHGSLNRAAAVIAHMEHFQPHAAIVTFVHRNGTINVTRFNHDGVAIPEGGLPVMQSDEDLPSHGGWVVTDLAWRPKKPPEPAKVEPFKTPTDADSHGGQVITDQNLRAKPETDADKERREKEEADEKQRAAVQQTAAQRRLEADQRAAEEQRARQQSGALGNPANSNAIT